MEIRVLNLEDKPKILSLISQKTRMIEPPGYSEKFAQTLDSYLANKKGNRAIGALINGELQSMLCMYKWEGFPYWSLTNLKNRLGTAIEKKGMVGCLQMALALAKADHWIRFYYLVPVRGRSLTDPKELSAFERAFPILHEYEITTDAVIPAGTRPDYSYMWSMMGGKTFSCDLFVRVASLKHVPYLSQLQKERSSEESTEFSKGFNSSIST